MSAPVRNVVWYWARRGIGVGYPSGCWGAAWPRSSAEVDTLARELRMAGYPARPGCLADGRPDGMPTADEFRAVNAECRAPIYEVSP